MEIISSSILLVDGNTDLLKSNADALKTRGYIVFTAASIAEARQTLDKEMVDAIVTEAVFTDGNGFDFCREVQGKNDIPILFLTALHGNDNEIKGLKAGGSHYITKPYDTGWYPQYGAAL